MWRNIFIRAAVLVAVESIVEHLLAQANRYDRLAQLCGAPPGSFLHQMADGYHALAQNNCRPAMSQAQQVVPPRL